MRNRSLAWVALAVIECLSNAAGARPTGGQVIGGQATISSAADTTNISQTSQRAVIDWNSFNVGTGEKVRFSQPNASAIALNRVHDSGASEIDGQMTANGNVWVINPNGVLFGKNAQVNVGGLLATTSDIANKDFMGGKYDFTAGGNPKASVANNGSITVAESGLAALVAPNVVNNGTIEAKLGKVQLGSGDIYTIDMNGDGLINLQASPAITSQLVANHGIIKADGGTVALTTAAASAEINSLINMDGLIQADTVSGKTGKVRIKSKGKTRFSGTINARGSVNGDNGGDAEVSGDRLEFSGHVDLGAPNGKVGTLLIDPRDLFITSDGSLPKAGASSISATKVQDLLANANVILSSTGTGTQTGDITIAAPLAWSSPQTLGLDAFHSIVVGSPITISNPHGTLVLAYNDGGTGGTLSFPGGNVSYTSGAGGLVINGHAYTLVDSVKSLASDVAANPNGFYALARSYDASKDGTFSDGPVPSFGGTFEGLGNSINNLSIGGPTSFDAALFQNILPTGFIENLGIVNIHASGGFEVAGLAGSNSGIISQSYATGTLTGIATSPNQEVIGGLVGINEGQGLIERSYAAVTASGPTGYIGGLAGINGLVNGKSGAVIEDSYSVCALQSTNNVSGLNIFYFVGGLTGDNEGLITRSYSSSIIKGVKGSVGGLTGVNGSFATITDSYSSGNVSNVAGGTGTDVNFDVGGLAGVNEGTIQSSFSTSSVIGGSVTGGLVGINSGTINNSNQTGTVLSIGFDPSGENGTGGIAGIASGTIENSNTSGSVSGLVNVGLLVGVNNKTTFINDTLHPAFPLTGALPTAFSPEIWGVAANTNGNQPYLLWQVPLPPLPSVPGGSTPPVPTSPPSPAPSPLGRPDVNLESQRINLESLQLTAQATNVPLIGSFGNVSPSPLGSLSPAAGRPAPSDPMATFNAEMAAYNLKAKHINDQIAAYQKELDEDIDEANAEEDALMPLLLDPDFADEAGEESFEIMMTLESQEKNIKAQLDSLYAQKDELQPPGAPASDGSSGDAQATTSAGLPDTASDDTSGTSGYGEAYPTSGGDQASDYSSEPYPTISSDASNGSPSPDVNATIFDSTSGGFTSPYTTLTDSSTASTPPSVGDQASLPSLPPSSGPSSDASTSGDGSRLNLTVSTLQTGYTAVDHMDPGSAAEDVVTDLIATASAGSDNAQTAKQLQESGQNVLLNQYLPRDSSGNVSLNGTPPMATRVQDISQCYGDLNCLQRITDQQMNNSNR